ncbi:unnamed protein product, partial [Urochloa humidicola]
NRTLISTPSSSGLSFGGLELSSGGAPTRTLIRPGEQLTPLPRRRGLFAPARQRQKQEMESWDHLVDTNVENSELEADTDDFQVGSIPIQQSIGESSAPVKGNKKRSKNFSEKEDVLLVSAWLEISMDPVWCQHLSMASCVILCYLLVP